MKEERKRKEKKKNRRELKVRVKRGCRGEEVWFRGRGAGRCCVGRLKIEG